MYYYKPIIRENISMHNIVEKYVSLPEIPVKSSIILNKIGIYNWNSATRKSEQQVQYKQLTAKLSESFPIESMHYAQADYVSPVVLFDGWNIEFRVDPAFWLPLADIFDGAAIKHGTSKVSIFPMQIYFDVNNEWIDKLFRAVGKDIIHALPNSLSST
jgi:hypothetical protein